MRKPHARRPERQGTATGGYWTGAHTTHRLCVHLVFVPKYRCRVLEDAVARRLVELLHQACEVRDWGIIEMNVQADHVHLLLQVTPCDCIADMMHALKGGTSRLLPKEFPNSTSFCGAKASGRMATTQRRSANRKSRVCASTFAISEPVGHRRNHCRRNHCRRKRGLRSVLKRHKSGNLSCMNLVQGHGFLSVVSLLRGTYRVAL